MTFGNQFHMPGSFHFEGPGASTALNANMFRPPVSPTTSSFNLSKSTGSLLSDNSMATTTNGSAGAQRMGIGRKRTHDEIHSSNSQRFPFPKVDTAGHVDDSATHRYTLAGQIETPGAQMMTPQAMEDSLYSDIDYRRALGSKRPLQQEDGFDGAPSRLENEPLTPRQAGWTTFAFQAIGGVVGKVWEFCRGGSGAFRGFQAGGGRAYEFNGQPVPTLSAESASGGGTIVADPQKTVPGSPPGAYPVPHESSYEPTFAAEPHEPTIVPDFFHEARGPVAEAPINPFQDTNTFGAAEAVPNPFQQTVSPEVVPAANTLQESDAQEPAVAPDLFQEPECPVDTTPDRPAAKRRQTSHLGENDELRRNWVMVDDDEPSPTPTRPPLGAKKSSIPCFSRIPAANGRINTPSRLGQSPRFSTPNGASKRTSAIPSPRFSSERLSSIPTRASSQASPAPAASFAGAGFSPSLHSREPASYASPRSPTRTSTPNPFATAPNGSRIPQPRGLGGSNPFANTRTTPSTTNTGHHQPRLSISSRPSSRGSPLHPSPLAMQQNPFTSRIAAPTTATGLGHRKSLSNVSAGSVRGRHSSFGYEEKLQTSPRLDDEGRQLATKRIATEKRNYSRLDKLNMELQGLIRQGQEALGTSYDVDMDEGWEEEDL